jgi:threonine dehydratase
MAGNGTTSLELIEESGPLDLLLDSLCGGWLLSVCATAATALSPGIEIWGVEPEAGDDWAQSFARGERVRLTEVPRTIADGQQTEAPGLLTWPTVRPLVRGIVTVSDDEIREAMRFLFERVKLVTEPSGASALAALLTGKVAARGKRVGVTISGGNIGVDGFCQILARRDG